MLGDTGYVELRDWLRVDAKAGKPLFDQLRSQVIDGVRAGALPPGVVLLEQAVRATLSATRADSAPAIKRRCFMPFPSLCPGAMAPAMTGSCARGCCSNFAYAQAGYRPSEG